MGVPVLYQGSKYKPRPLVAIPGPATPHFVSAEIGNVDNSTVVVTFDRDVQAAENDWLFGVTITFNGNPTGMIAGFRQANHAVVYYDLVAGATNTDVLTWAYDGAGFIVSEADSTPLAAVTAQAVTNNVAPSGPVPLLDLEADTQTLGALATWTGEEAAHHAFTQNTGAAQPIVQVVGGYKAVRFDGIDDVMVGGDWINNMDSFTIITCHAHSDSVVTGSALLTKLFSGSDNGLYLLSDPGSLYSFVAGASGYIWVTLDGGSIAKRIVTFEMASRSAGHIYMNGVNTGESDSSVYPVTDYTNTEPFRLGNEGDLYAPLMFAGDVYAIRLYSPALSSTDRAAVEAELAARYGVTL